MKEKVGFGSKIGLLAATIGSAVGLGTIWRFPAIVQEQGGSAFLLVYLICLFLGLK
jgi:NSS family neurotransmitter:Na+ symporter